MAFADLPKNREGPTRRFLGPHIFDRVCLEHGIEHRLTKPYHPWTNGQELPPIKQDVTRVRLFGGHCACCGARAVALAPGGLEPGSPFASRSPHWWCTCITPTPSGWNGRLAALDGRMFALTGGAGSCSPARLTQLVASEQEGGAKKNSRFGLGKVLGILPITHLENPERAVPTIEENHSNWGKTYDWSQAGDEWSKAWGTPTYAVVWFHFAPHQCLCSC